MFRNLFLSIALAGSMHTTVALACNNVTQTFGTTMMAASSNCSGLVGGRVGQCTPMNPRGDWWSCQCFTGCGYTEAAYSIAAAFETATPDFSCRCRALDDNNPMTNAACAALTVGTTCGRVGNIICIPECR